MGFFLSVAAPDLVLEERVTEDFKYECILETLENNNLPLFSDSNIQNVVDGAEDSHKFEFTLQVGSCECVVACGVVQICK
eukprot:345483-Chlamydomonas_euryale.AAC.2